MSDKKVWKQIDILELLNRQDIVGDKAVCRAVVAIYKRQTDAEKQREFTIEHNGVGFNSADSSLLSSFAKQIIARSHRPGCPLSSKQLYLARTRITKYARQLADIANGG